MAGSYGNAAPANGKKKKLAIMGCSAILLVAVVAAVAVGTSRHNSGGNAGGSQPDSGDLQASTKAIKSICQPTDYKETCETTLQSAAGNTTDPKELVKMAFKVAMDHIREGFKHSKLLERAEKDPRASAALRTCNELLDYAIGDLSNSFDQLGALDITKIDDILDDLKVWLSAAITYQETCLDGFESTKGSAGESMRQALNASMELTSNTLAIANEISSVLTQFNLPFFSRRLLSAEEGEEYPAWVTTGRRRLLEAAPGEVVPNVTVAQDGSGDYTNISQALAVVPLKSNETFVIYIKEGVYEEQVNVTRSMTNVMMIGDGSNRTKITGSLNFIDGTPTFRTATVGIVGDGFIGKDLWIENSAGPEKHQAVALRVQSDLSVFYNCRMDGYQDTLYAHTKRQFYRECTITGTVDFIFGDSATVLQNCLIIARKPLANQQNIVTAQGRKDRNEATALILHNCTITADPELYPVRTQLPTYLGRPWKEYSRTFIMQSQIDDLIHPSGWLPWMGDFGLRTLFYTEFDNRGPGAVSTQRVKWRGIKTITFDHALKFTVERFIQGNQWINATGVPYIPGLLPVTEATRVH